jgi:hypothetical protein
MMGCTVTESHASLPLASLSLLYSLGKVLHALSRTVKQSRFVMRYSKLPVLNCFSPLSHLEVVHNFLTPSHVSITLRQHSIACLDSSVPYFITSKRCHVFPRVPKQCLVYPRTVTSSIA